MRRRGTAIRGGHLLLGAVLVLPPSARVAIHVIGVRESASRDLETLEAARLASADPDGIRLEDLDFQDPEGRYVPVQADAIPISDPSAARRVLWAMPRGGAAVPRDTAAVLRGALVGRVVRAPRLRLVRIQTIRDPEFRVLFRAQETGGSPREDGSASRGGSGLLRAAGVGSDGSPLLEFQHLSPGCELTVGMPIFTEGGDGVYPPGVLIGQVLSAQECGRGEEPDQLLVRAALRPEDCVRVVLPVDRRKAEALEYEAAYARKGGGR